MSLSGFIVTGEHAEYGKVRLSQPTMFNSTANRWKKDIIKGHG